MTRYEHCLSVSYIALELADKLRANVDRRSMVRGALLHDFFMYDWHDPGNLRLMHGFTHAKEALQNAQKEFELNDIERDVTKSTCFREYRGFRAIKETVLVSAADKISAVLETMHNAKALYILRMCKGVGL